jgi:hypothetical protein
MRIFLISWEFPGYNTKQGTALCKRPGDFARLLGEHVSEVIVVTRNHFNVKVEYPERNIILIPGKSLLSQKWWLIRKLSTFYHTIFFGDRSGVWGTNVANYLINHQLVRSNDTVISFFSPRGPILTGYRLRCKLDIKWVVDFQDNYNIGQKYKWLGKWWMRKMLRKADLCVHVSPEWANSDGSALDISFEVIRHALPNLQKIRRDEITEEFTFIYYGGYNSDHQYHEFFFEYLKENPHVKFAYAGFEKVNEIFKTKINNKQYTYLGWLSSQELHNQLTKVKTVVVFGYTLATRLVVPSKLYELIAMKMPVLIVGSDSGGIYNLEKEFNFHFPKVLNSSDLDEILSTNKESKQQDYLEFEPLSQNAFANNYMNLLNQGNSFV